MKNAIKQIGDKFGVDRFHYSVVVYGASAPKKEFAFDDPIPFEEELIRRVNNTVIIAGANKLVDALKEAQTILNTNVKRRPTSRKAIVLISDSSSGDSPEALKQAIQPIHEEGIIVVASSVGDQPQRDTLRAMTTRSDDVIQVTNSDKSGYLGDRIVARILKGMITSLNNLFGKNTCRLSNDSELIKLRLQIASLH